MAPKRGATFRRRELGKELRKLRDKKGETLQEVAKALGFSHPKLARVEIGENDLPRVGDLESLIHHLDPELPKEDWETLLQLHRESLSKEPWTPYKAYMPSKMPTYRGLEQDATVMRAWQPAFVFGLFQTESYARALYQIAKPVDETTSEYIEQNVRLRLERKEMITRSVDPLELRVIMDETAVRRIVGGPEVMAAQFEEIVVLGELDHVTIQILPHDVVTYRSEGNFILLDFSETLDPVVQIDMSNTISVTDERQEVQRNVRRFDAMRDSALPPARTAGFLQQLAREWK
ncbi:MULTISPECIES: helix-turn-helix transcriptional regulator [unclassified Streptomyces]|uniref:helix-turn-helix domain-containing protein n=1 Tax=unclassified Streptomyces TaxID=2593676 RepID=UPI00081D5D3A|nr:MULTISPECIES: helix-turn-helix transcriptional regulator [unclassified Streptomyces]MYR69250.1 helix-turn-helix domain-containing protein [Streptomyces sp. SID4939]MYS01045.1 helix-turn-helix domain-containing protein [Streptomyces sp. SID4940]SCD90263.1 Helix-turn-helix domain-containing protein [Streptomyces sp. DpondAA-F4a]SCM13695.1 Helix-turn-helix domain-containing protein [Streptomyces sp. DpondAA-F4]